MILITLTMYLHIKIIQSLHLPGSLVNIYTGYIYHKSVSGTYIDIQKSALNSIITLTLFCQISISSVQDLI